MEETTNRPLPFMSAEIGEISAALSAFQASIEQPKLEKEVSVKMKSGGKYSFKYADLSACAKAAAPVLGANGLSVSQIIHDGKLVTLLSHKSGQWLKSELYLPQQTNDYQSYGSAITYLKRYSYCAILGIVADTDDDANMAMGNVANFNDNKAAAQVAFTGAQLDQAIKELNTATTEEQFNAIWGKWAKAAPTMTRHGTEFYNAASQRINVIRNSSDK